MEARNLKVEGKEVINIRSLITNYLLTSNVRSLRENLGPRPCRIDRATVKTERSRLISCLLYGFLLGFCRPVIGPWALRENNALVLANQSTR